MQWDTELCSTNDKCATNCVVEGADYSATYGITVSGSALTLKFITKGSYSTNIGSRTYLMKDTNTYQIFNLIGNEFTFDVDVSQLPCGLNGALYFVVMDAKGQGTAGAKYGAGYCDGQCPRDLKFINGKVNYTSPMLSLAHKGHRPMLKTGNHLQMTRMLVWVSEVPAG